MGKVLWTVIILAIAFLLSPENFRTDYLQGIRVLISDADSPLGQELAQQYATMNATLVLVGTDQERLDRLASRCSELGARNSHVLIGDLAVGQNRRRVVDEAGRLLDGKLDTLILNHGDYFTASWLGTRQNFSSLENVMNVNFVSHVDLASLCLPLLRRTGGNIGVVSSLAAKVPVPLTTTYSAAKAALSGFFSSLRQELLQEQSKLSVTTVVLGTMPSDADMMPASKYLPFFQTFFTAPVEDCAFNVIRSVALRKYEVTYPLMAYLQRTFYNFMPDIYEYNMHYIES